MPRVSVIIPTFNCGRFLSHAIESALAQTYTDREILVVDDGSTDDTADVLSRFEDRVICLRQSNRGATPARYFALSQSTGELIAYLDSDDVWYPNKLDTQVAFLDAHRECGVVHSDATIIDEMDRVLHHRFNLETGRAVPQGVNVTDLLQHNHVELPTVVQRRECLEIIGFDERVGGAGDYLQWILTAMEGIAIGYIDEPLTMYRRRHNSMQTNRRKALEELVLLFEILLEEKELAQRAGAEAANIARERLRALQRELAYRERSDGGMQEATRRIASLIRESPLQVDLYVELLKGLVPVTMSRRLRDLREKWA